MSNFAAFLTPEEYVAKCAKSGIEAVGENSIERIQAKAKDEGTCLNCDEHVWRLGGCELCFTCTTGESDASEDYEVGVPY